MDRFGVWAGLDSSGAGLGVFLLQMFFTMNGQDHLRTIEGWTEIKLKFLG